ncbi:hypothetical protein VM57_10340 [Stenotrophomonas maltophilia]|uniref:Uncharacterized protein n=1 Tax=Stenotrophomonas maltophilia TaxID=40324 RepID=A0A0F5ZPL0_STEMA|nr:hypothetical protein VM57_10340 [Stenotrophomonas maltophilia]
MSPARRRWNQRFQHQREHGVLPRAQTRQGRLEHAARAAFGEEARRRGHVPGRIPGLHSLCRRVLQHG